MSFLLSLLQLFLKSDFFSKVLVLGLFFLGIFVFIIFFYGILRFYYKKNEVVFVLKKIKEKHAITGEENYFSSILFYVLKKNKNDFLLSALVSVFLKTELKMKSFFGGAAAISPLLGLLGTIWGIMHVFLNLEKSGADLSALAPGIAEALITTLAGLFVAIPALIAYHVFVYFIKSYMLLVELVYEEVVENKVNL
jgi:biopolymer transport protein TolQ